MGVLIGIWYFVSEQYSEQTALSRWSFEDATGKSRGQVALLKEKAVVAECTVYAGASLPELPTMGATLTLPVLGSTSNLTFAALTSTNPYAGVQPGPGTVTTDNWAKVGNAVCKGYESREMGLLRWQIKLQTTGMDIKRGWWWGTMTPAKFQDIASSSGSL